MRPHTCTSLPSSHPRPADPQKRAAFDRFGHEDGFTAAAQRRQTAQPQPAGFGGGFGTPAGQDFDAEELFRAFFGGGMGAPGGFGFHVNGFPPRRPARPAAPPPQGLQGLLQQAQPLVLLLLFFILPAVLQPTAPASLQRGGSYPHAMATAARDVPYYVPDAGRFTRDYPPASRERARLEGELEQRYRDAMRHLCREEVEAERFWGGGTRGGRKQGCEELQAKSTNVVTFCFRQFRRAQCVPPRDGDESEPGRVRCARLPA